MTTKEQKVLYVGTEDIFALIVEFETSPGWEECHGEGHTRTTIQLVTNCHFRFTRCTLFDNPLLVFSLGYKYMLNERNPGNFLTGEAPKCKRKGGTSN